MSQTVLLICIYFFTMLQNATEVDHDLLVTTTPVVTT